MIEFNIGDIYEIPSVSQNSKKIRVEAVTHNVVAFSILGVINDNQVQWFTKEFLSKQINNHRIEKVNEL